MTVDAYVDGILDFVRTRGVMLSSEDEITDHQLLTHAFMKGVRFEDAARSILRKHGVAVEDEEPTSLGGYVARAMAAVETAKPSLDAIAKRRITALIKDAYRNGVDLPDATEAALTLIGAARNNSSRRA